MGIFRQTPKNQGPRNYCGTVWDKDLPMEGTITAVIQLYSTLAEDRYG